MLHHNGMSCFFVHSRCYALRREVFDLESKELSVRELEAANKKRELEIQEIKIKAEAEQAKATTTLLNNLVQFTTSLVTTGFVQAQPQMPQ